MEVSIEKHLNAPFDSGQVYCRNNHDQSSLEHNKPHGKKR